MISLSADALAKPADDSESQKQHDRLEPAVFMDAVTVEFASGDQAAPRRVLDAITLQVTPGEFVVLVGRSG